MRSGAQGEGRGDEQHTRWSKEKAAGQIKGCSKHLPNSKDAKVCTVRTTRDDSALSSGDSEEANS